MVFVNNFQLGNLYCGDFWSVVPAILEAQWNHMKTRFQLNLVAGQLPESMCVYIYIYIIYTHLYNLIYCIYVYILYIYVQSVGHVLMANRFWDLWRRHCHTFVLHSRHVWNLQPGHFLHQGSGFSSPSIWRLHKSSGYPQLLSMLFFDFPV